MDRTVRLLSAELANQIAAGEVVERPASVVKELVENALDAGAKRVTVAIRGGGIDSIVVSDDGHGMDEENARLALLRHATSKLRAFDDLERLSSFGFRGEALPSIASVSEFELETRSDASDHGIALTRDGDTFRSRVIGRPIGTSIKVHRLFENVPARRKFLKSSGTEAAQVADVVLEAALGRPDVAFEFVRDERTARKYAKTSGRGERARLIWPDAELLSLSLERGPLRLEAFLSTKDNAQRGASGLKLIVNGRAVRDRGIAGTIAHAASEHLPRGYYPRGVVYIDLPTSLVDVNVHPQKLEVRFAEPRPLLDALHAAVKRVYERAANGETSLEASHSTAPHETALPLAPFSFARSTGVSREAPFVTAEKRDSLDHYARRFSDDSPKRTGDVAPANEPLVVPASRHEARTAPSLRPRFEFLGKHERGFWIVSSALGVHFVDPHALAEVALYEELRDEIVAGSARKKSLLFPTSLRTSEEVFERLEGRLEALAAFGFEIRLRSRENVQLLSIPELLDGASTPRIAAAVLEYFGSAKYQAEPQLSEVLPPLACLGAACRTSSPEELLTRFETSGHASECIHGRVIVAETRAEDLVRRLVAGSESSP